MKFSPKLVHHQIEFQVKNMMDFHQHVEAVMVDIRLHQISQIRPFVLIRYVLPMLSDDLTHRVENVDFCPVVKVVDPVFGVEVKIRIWVEFDPRDVV